MTAVKEITPSSTSWDGFYDGLVTSQEQASVLEPREATVEGARVAYLYGGAGRPLVFLHGIGGGRGDWSDNLTFFAERGYSVYAPNLPGHGSSDPPAPGWRPRDGGRTVLAMLDAWKLESATLIGNSAGGLVAMQAALEAPKRVDALVLAAPSGFVRRIHPGFRLLTVPLLGELLWRPNWLTARAAIGALFADKSRVSPGLLDSWQRRRSDPRERAVFLRLLRQGASVFGLRRDLILADRLHGLLCPTLLIWGREDEVLPFRDAAPVLERVLPKALTLLFSPCGHWPQVEQAERFNEAVSEWLKAHVFYSGAKMEPK